MFDQSIHLVFDLDDTLYSERDYVRSALAFVGDMAETVFAVENASAFLLQAYENGEVDAIGSLWAAWGLPSAARSDVVAAMRGHRPNIKLPRDSLELLTLLSVQGAKWSILTDGRSLTQRRKIEALGLTDASGIYISEERGVCKPSLKAFTQIINDYPDAAAFWYVADNPAKDFVTPNALGWKTIMLRDSGQNIHPQCLNTPRTFRAEVEVRKLTEILRTDG